MKYLTSLLFFLIWCASGCGPSMPKGMPQLYPADVTVTMDGKPLDSALVNFIPKSSENRENVCAELDVNGHALLKTRNKYTGAPLGDYIVTMQKSIPDPNWKPDPKFPEMPPVFIFLVPERFNDPEKTTLQCTVTESESNHFVFDIKSK